MATKKKAGKKTGNGKGGKKKTGAKKQTAGKKKTSSKKKSGGSASSSGLLTRAQNLVSDVLGGATQTATGAIETVVNTGKEVAGMRKKK